MAVTIGARYEYVKLLQEKLEQDSLTGMFTLADDYVRATAEAGTVEIPKFSVLDGFYDYNKSTGFTAGSVTLAYQAVTLSYDRGVSFTIDRVDDMDAAYVASAELMNEFFRTKLVPEVDAARISRLAVAANSASHSAYGSLTASTVLAAIDAGEASIGQVADPTEAILFVSWGTYSLMKQAAQYRFTAGQDPDSTFERFDGMRVVRVPDARFGARFTKGNGAFTSSGSINFLMALPESAKAVTKLDAPKVFDPDTNQTADAWLFQYRLHHDMFVLDQKVDGLYVHTIASNIWS